MALTVSQVNYKDSSSWTSLIDMVYPKGSIFLGYNLMNKNDTNSANHPGKLFGGSWLPIENKMLRSGWGSAAGGSDTHRHYVSTTDNNDGSRGGYCIAAIGATAYTVSSLGYNADTPPAQITDPSVENSWSVAAEYANKTLSNTFLPKGDEPIKGYENVTRYTIFGTDSSNSSRYLNHGVRVYGWTALSEHIPAYQTVNTWYRTS